MTEHTHNGLGKGLRIVTQGQTYQEEYMLRQPGIHKAECQQCNPLAKAGSQRKEQNPLHPETRKKARKWSKKTDEKLAEAIDKDLANRNIKAKKPTQTNQTEPNDTN